MHRNGIGKLSGITFLYRTFNVKVNFLSNQIPRYLYEDSACN